SSVTAEDYRSKGRRSFVVLETVAGDCNSEDGWSEAGSGELSKTGYYPQNNNTCSMVAETPEKGEGQSYQVVAVKRIDATREEFGGVQRDNSE
ncbi:hypothetical protein A2U01_0066979, partial [Trifolium medium]|nr:hypothetical protein [Trifolium medium]